MNPLIDVYIVTYNRADYLSYSIQSVLNQTYGDFNLYVLDNCSTDNTPEIIHRFNDKRLRYIRHNENRGGLENINFAYGHASNKYFVVFHDDDIMKPYFLEREIAIMEENPKYAAVSCQVDLIDAKGNKIKSAPQHSSKSVAYKEGEFFRAYLGSRTCIMFPTVMYRREFIQKNGIILRKEAGPSADILVSFELERLGGVVAVINEALVNYRCHEGQDSQISRIFMVEKLFNYLKQIPYYSAILKDLKREQHNFYKSLMFDEICMAASGKAKWTETQKAKETYERVLDTVWFDRAFYAITIRSIRYFPQVMNKLYLVGKKHKTGGNGIA